MRLARVSLVLGCCLAVVPLMPGAEPAPAAQVNRVKITTDKAPDCSTLKTMVESVTRDCKTNDEKAIAIYNFMRLTHYHRAYPSEPGGLGVLKEIHCYGWSLCGGLHAEQSALWREMGWNWRFVGWPGHTTVEAFYDGRWHFLDVFLKFYAWMPDPNNPGKRTIAGQDDLVAHPKELILDAFVLDKSRKVYYAKDNVFELIGEKANWQAPAFLVCGDTLEDIPAALKKKNRAGSPEGWAGIAHSSGSYSTDVNLAPGFALTNTWDPSAEAWFWRDSKIAPCHTCGDKEIRNSPEKGPVAEPYLSAEWKCESYANGRITFRADFSDANCLRSFAAVENVKVADKALVPVDAGKPAFVVVKLQSPYLLTQAAGTALGVDKFEVSIDDGKTWKPAELKDFGALVKGQLQALCRLSIRDKLTVLSLQAVVQNNPFALPYLAPGKNTITVSVADTAALGDNKLVVTYAYRPGSRRKSYEQLCLEGKEIGRGHDASWDKTPTVVQKVFTARDLPAKFDIDVPTPKDRFPVYPRMLFIRREVVSANQKPLPLPEDAHEPKIGPGDELKTLPNPLLVGTQPPPPRVIRKVKTMTVDLTGGPFVAKSGKAPEGDLLRWPKNEKEKVESVAYLVNGELKNLPALKDLAAARLIVPAVRGHEKAPTKVGVTALQAPFVAGQAYDFKKLGDALGTATVPTHSADAADWAPPKEIKLDVTRALRLIASGDAKFHGFAVRVVPDRGVDDGWTVRVKLPKEPKVYLEIDVYADGDSKAAK
jgi:hypothetical protein